MLGNHVGSCHGRGQYTREAVVPRVLDAASSVIPGRRKVTIVYTDLQAVGWKNGQKAKKILAAFAKDAHVRLQGPVQLQWNAQYRGEDMVVSDFIDGSSSNSATIFLRALSITRLPPLEGLLSSAAVMSATHSPNTPLKIVYQVTQDVSLPEGISVARAQEKIARKIGKTNNGYISMENARFPDNTARLFEIIDSTNTNVLFWIDVNEGLTRYISEKHQAEPIGTSQAKPMHKSAEGYDGVRAFTGDEYREEMQRRARGEGAANKLPARAENVMIETHAQRSPSGTSATVTQHAVGTTRDSKDGSAIYHDIESRDSVQKTRSRKKEVYQEQETVADSDGSYRGQKLTTTTTVSTPTSSVTRRDIAVSETSETDRGYLIVTGPDGQSYRVGPEQRVSSSSSTHGQSHGGSGLEMNTSKKKSSVHRMYRNS
jgi:hypothetical protein